jgi:hypothetical protein
MIASLIDRNSGVDVISDCLAKNVQQRAAVENAIRAFCNDKKNNRPMPRERLNILNRDEGIFELKPDKLRLVFFCDENIKIHANTSVVFKSMAFFVLFFRKTKQKTKPEYIEKAVQIKHRYLREKNQNGVSFVEPE